MWQMKAPNNTQTSIRNLDTGATFVSSLSSIISPKCIDIFFIDNVPFYLFKAMNWFTSDEAYILFAYGVPSEFLRTQCDTFSNQFGVLSNRKIYTEIIDEINDFKPSAYPNGIKIHRLERKADQYMPGPIVITGLTSSAIAQHRQSAFGTAMKLLYRPLMKTNYVGCEYLMRTNPFCDLRYKVYALPRMSNNTNNNIIKSALRHIICEINDLMQHIGSTRDQYKKYVDLRFQLAMVEIMMYYFNGDRHRDDPNVSDISTGYDPSPGAALLWNIVVNSIITESVIVNNDNTSQHIWNASRSICDKIFCLNNDGPGCHHEMYGHLHVPEGGIVIFPNPDVALLGHRAENIGQTMCRYNTISKIYEYLADKKKHYLTILLLNRNLSAKIIDNAPNVPNYH
eukprot:279942_1